MEETNLKSSYDRDGFTVVRQFLPQNEFAELQGELSRYIRFVVPTLPETAAFYENRSRPETLKQLNHMSVDPYFNDYVQNPRWVNLATDLIGEPAVAISATEWFNKPAGTNHPTPPHQDNYYFNLTPAHVLTLWLAMEDVDEENGCLRYLPGSHRQGRLPHQPSSVLGFSQGLTEYGEQERAREVPVVVKANDLLIHHGWTVHRADPNRSLVRNRPSFAIAFRGLSCRVDEAASQAYRDSLQKQHDAFGVNSQPVS